MSDRAAPSIAVAALLVLSLVAGVTAVANTAAATSTSSTTDLDEDTPLTNRSTYETWQSQGYATVNIGYPDMSITVASEHEHVGLNGWRNDYSSEYLRISYNEEIDRTVRFYVPAAYWKPYLDQNLKPEKGGVTASVAPVQGGKFMSVTVTFTEPTTVIYEISQLKSVTWSSWSSKADRAGNVSNVDTSTKQWSYAQLSDWSSDGTLQVENVSDPDQVMIQYDASSGSTEAWLMVPSSQSEPAPVYYFTRTSTNNSSGNATIVVVSEESEPPAVRFKRSASTSSGVLAVLEDWSQIPNRVGELVDSLFGTGKK